MSFPMPPAKSLAPFADNKCLWNVFVSWSGGLTQMWPLKSIGVVEKHRFLSRICSDRAQSKKVTAVCLLSCTLGPAYSSQGGHPAKWQECDCWPSPKDNLIRNWQLKWELRFSAEWEGIQRRKSSSKYAKLQGGKVPAPSLEATAVYGTVLSVMVLLVTCLKY